MSIDQFILHEGYTVYGYNDMRLRLKLVRKDETKEKNETLNINFYNNVSYNSLNQELFYYPGTPWSIKIFKFNRPPY